MINKVNLSYVFTELLLETLEEMEEELNAAGYEDSRWW